ncbi:unnamed protein product, partial [Didymodactylos carnosus]
YGSPATRRVSVSAVTSCGHLFCVSCLQKMFLINPSTCAVCPASHMKYFDMTKPLPEHIAIVITSDLTALKWFDDRLETGQLNSDQLIPILNKSNEIRKQLPPHQLDNYLKQRE